MGEHVQNGISDLLKPLPRHRARRPGPRRGELPLYTVTNGFPGAAGLQAGRERHGRAAPPAERRRPGGPAGHQATHDFQCVTGWVVSGVHWAGVRLTELARLAGPGRGRRCSTSPPSTGPTPRPSRQTRPS